MPEYQDITVDEFAEFQLGVAGMSKGMFLSSLSSCMEKEEDFRIHIRSVSLRIPFSEIKKYTEAKEAPAPKAGKKAKKADPLGVPDDDFADIAEGLKG
uniref:Uncharacterized protein n=1 Tax=viral metagenome TaxID=1070528 RepID=A0A6M3IFM2_9ZZZZ